MATTSLTNTNINDTYVGVLHAKGAPIPASGLEWVYDGFGNKSSLAIGRDGNGIAVSGTLSGNSLDDNFFQYIVDRIFPVGSVFMSVDNINPQVRFGGTWEQTSEGKFIVGTGTGNDGYGNRTFTAGDTNNGRYDHILNNNEMPAHSHAFTAQQKINGYTDNGGKPDERSIASSTTTDTTGMGIAHNNTPPGYGVYIWKRTA